MYLLDKSKLRLTDRRDPANVSRAMSALVSLSQWSAVPLQHSLLLLTCSSFPGTMNAISGCIWNGFLWDIASKEIEALLGGGTSEQHCSKPPSPKLAAAPVVVLPYQLCWRGQHRGLCFGGNRSLWWDPFGALWFKIQDAELIFTALSRGATSLLISRWRLSNQGSPQPAPAALVGLTGLWSTWEATE